MANAEALYQGYKQRMLEGDEADRNKAMEDAEESFAFYEIITEQQFLALLSLHAEITGDNSYLRKYGRINTRLVHGCYPAE